MSKIPVDVCDALEKCMKEKIDNFEITVHDGNKKGVGFLGDMLFISLQHKKTGENHHLVIKQVLPCNKPDSVELMSTIFFNETKFYSHILPTMLEFQKSFPKAEVIDIVAKYYGSVTEKGKEKVILENLKFKNYTLHPKIIPLEEKMYEFIFQNYAKYHALAFAFAKSNPQKIVEWKETLGNNFIKMNINDLMKNFIVSLCKKIQNILEENNEEEILKKFQIYIDDAFGLYEKNVQYDGPYKIVSHGDGWSNNMMFKYNLAGELTDMKLLDFQISSVSSPIHDLLYSFYSGASASCLDSWQRLLKHYHNHLGYYLKQYDLDVEIIYSYEEMVKEWRKYIPFGLLMAGLIWENKYGPEHAIVDVSTAVDAPSYDKCDVEVIKEKFDPHLLSIMRHFHKYNLL